MRHTMSPVADHHKPNDIAGMSWPANCMAHGVGPRLALEVQLGCVALGVTMFASRSYAPNGPQYTILIGALLLCIRVQREHAAVAMEASELCLISVATTMIGWVWEVGGQRGQPTSCVRCLPAFPWDGNRRWCLPTAQATTIHFVASNALAP